MASLSREGWVKTCFVVSLWVFFALSSASFTLVQLACSNWVSGSVPLRRGRDNAVAVQWRWPAAVAPRSCSQESGSNALVGRLCRGPARSAGFWIGFAWYHETPFTLENRYGSWPQTGCVTVPGREAAFLGARQRFPYRSRFNFSVKNRENMLPCNAICDVMHIDLSRKIYCGANYASIGF